jgi:hypothetical protein
VAAWITIGAPRGNPCGLQASWRIACCLVLWHISSLEEGVTCLRYGCEEEI